MMRSVINIWRYGLSWRWLRLAALVAVAGCGSPTGVANGTDADVVDGADDNVADGAGSETSAPVDAGVYGDASVRAVPAPASSVTGTDYAPDTIPGQDCHADAELRTELAVLRAQLDAEERSRARITRKLFAHRQAARMDKARIQELEMRNHELARLLDEERLKAAGFEQPIFLLRGHELK